VLTSTPTNTYKLLQGSNMAWTNSHTMVLYLDKITTDHLEPHKYLFDDKHAY
jgi:hypothetical protein